MKCLSELTLSIYADGELVGDEARAAVTHLETCGACRTLLAALEVENTVLTEVLTLQEEKSVATSPAVWLWGSAAMIGLVPMMFDRLVQTLPTLPPGFAWLESLGLREGAFALVRTLFNASLGADEMFVPIFAFATTLLVAVAALSLPTLQRLAAGAVPGGMALTLLLALAFPATANATEFRFVEDGHATVGADESIDESVFISGETVTVDGTINGDVFAFGERVDINGSVNGSVYSGAKTIRITGAVSGNVHLAGAEIDVASTVAGSAYLLGEKLTVGEGGVLSRGGAMVGASVRVAGEVERGLLVAAEEVRIESGVKDSVVGHVGRFTLSSTGSVGGDLELTVPSEDVITIADGATVAGATTVELQEPEKSDFVQPDFYLGMVASVIALLIVGFLFMTLFPSSVPNPPQSSSETLRSLGIGALVLIGTPVAMLIAALTLVGIPVALIVGAIYAVLMYTSTLVVAYFVGQRLLGTDGMRVALGTALSLLVILLLVEVPLLGPGLSFLVHAFGLGCLVIHLRERYAASRASAEDPTAPAV